MRNRVCLMAVAVQALVFSVVQPATAWEHHPLITEPIVSTMPEVGMAALAPATSLRTFLLAVEAELPVLLAEEEAWARDNLPSYAPRPDALAFQVTGNPDEIIERFFRAIRLNPTIKTPLYLSPLAGSSSAAKRRLEPAQVSILQDTDNLSIFDFDVVAENALLKPIDVIAAASNEPDYGMDIGLFEDNNTEFGKHYGFGVQPFGNPGLDYGSQAPFHMGFYHESPIVFLFASFLKQSYPEHRIHLFKSLSEFAFSHGQAYWGWRFMGWGLHYMCDLSMPYHTTALPGYSTMRMLLINLLDMIGWPAPKDNAVQLSSNRHVALETYQGIVLAEAYRNNNTQDVTLAALRQSRTIPPYSDIIPRTLLSGASYDLSAILDRTIADDMPAQFVSDPSVELGDRPDRYQIVDMIEAEHGSAALAEINQLQAKALAGFAIYGRSYVLAILGPEKQCAPHAEENNGYFSRLLRHLFSQ